MIHVVFDPENRPDLLTQEQRDWFAAWRARAQQATERVVTAWEAWRMGNKNFDSLSAAQKEWLTNWKAGPDAKRLLESKDGKFKYEFEEEIWGELKDWLLENVFNHKCAYCEQGLHSQPRHAEHFRPKAQVTLGGGAAEKKARNKKARVKDEANQELTHPGYFWLAYHWQNLLPSCTFCNTMNGKKDKFPVLKDYAPMMRQLDAEVFQAINPIIIRSQHFGEIYYLQPHDLDAIEARAILHPYLDDPQRYLTFDDFGQAVCVGVSEDEKKIANYSIEVYNLNGDGLIKDRRQAQFRAMSYYSRAIAQLMDANLSGTGIRAIKEMAKEETLTKIVRTDQPFTAAMLAGLKNYDPDIFT